jgi:hypothetical protein
MQNLTVNSIKKFKNKFLLFLKRLKKGGSKLKWKKINFYAIQ